MIRQGRGRKFVLSSTYDQAYSKIFTTERYSENYDNYESVIKELFDETITHFNNLLAKMGTDKRLTYLFVFRSGVSDKEKFRIMNNEIAPLVDTYEKNGVKMCYTVVNKKTDMKFFVTGNYDNAPSGTVIDSGCTSPDNFEFYLQPQFVTQGTATPIHYHVLFDNSGIPLEVLETLANSLCYYYWGWQGAVRLPAPLKFAEKANAFLSKNNIRNINDAVKMNPYFI
jgi:hypothetical protein